jgi:hypothetical protein
MCFGWADKNAYRILNWGIFGKIILEARVGDGRLNYDGAYGDQ